MPKAYPRVEVVRDEQWGVWTVYLRLTPDSFLEELETYKRHEQERAIEGAHAYVGGLRSALWRKDYSEAIDG